MMKDFSKAEKLVLKIASLIQTNDNDKEPDLTPEEEERPTMDPSQLPPPILDDRDTTKDDPIQR